VVRHKFLRFWKKKKYSMYEIPAVRDYRDGKITKEQLDALSTCDLCAVADNGLSAASRAQLAGGTTGEELVAKDLARQHLDDGRGNKNA
jgi:hypothetical protein